MKVFIRKLGHSESVPMDLLILADPSMEMIEKYVFSSDCYVVELNNEIVGAFVLQPKSSEEIELKNISITQNQQRNGIGKEIIKFVTRMAKLEGYSSMIAKFPDSNEKAKEFCIKMKFEQICINKGFYVLYYNEVSTVNGFDAEDQLVFRRDL